MSQDNITGSESTNSKKKNKKPRGNFQKQTRVQSQIESQLATLFTRARVAEGHHRAIEELGQEGIDHININRYSKTTLGYLLSTNAKLEFKVLGKDFNSIGNLIGYYKSHCTNEDIALSVVEPNSQYGGDDLKRFPPFKNLYAIVCLGYWDIILNNHSLFNALSINDLPLDSYIDRKGVRERHQTTNILISAIKEALMAVKQERLPRLDSFIFEATLRSLYRQARQEGIDVETAIAKMFHSDTVRAEYMKLYGDAILKEEQAKAEEAKQKMTAPIEDGTNDAALQKTYAESVGIPSQELDDQTIDAIALQKASLGFPTEERSQVESSVCEDESQPVVADPASN